MNPLELTLSPAIDLSIKKPTYGVVKYQASLSKVGRFRNPRRKPIDKARMPQEIAWIAKGERNGTTRSDKTKEAISPHGSIAVEKQRRMLGSLIVVNLHGCLACQAYWQAGRLLTAVSVWTKSCEKSQRWKTSEMALQDFVFWFWSAISLGLCLKGCQTGIRVNKEWAEAFHQSKCKFRPPIKILFSNDFIRLTIIIFRQLEAIYSMVRVESFDENASDSWL
jgi:hypothetical protein